MGKDAATVINAIDKVSRSDPSCPPPRLTKSVFLPALKLLRENQVPDGTKLHALQLLQKLAGASRQVPKSYFVGNLTWFKVWEEVIEHGGFSDIRRGKLGGKVVAVKTIRTSLETNGDVVNEVREVAGCSILGD